jgi:hypothetical protein
VISTSLPQKFQAREYRFIRAVVFTMLGMWGVVPVTHLLLTHGHVWAIRSAFQLDMLMGLIYLVSPRAVCLCAFVLCVGLLERCVLWVRGRHPPCVQR